ncbi:TRAPP trafficking subunit Trs65-domain-containing protein [Phellopilus nigrolimitatus]|nr:TRAPP trafficking subunit Trs65-domain-containing protein [Phellopilus nigrolimitatus]
MANAEYIFNSCALDLIVPDSVLRFPAHEDGIEADTWLSRARDCGERSKAFFDEDLDFYLAIRFKQQDQPSNLLSPDPFSPPALLLSFLNHLQVSVEATYISPTSNNLSPNGRSPVPPVRTSSTGLTLKAKGLGVPPPIILPQTPSPVPSTSETDKRYVFSEGTLLKALIWGEESIEDADSFRLLRSSQEKCWIAIYKLSVVVAFVRTQVTDPLLCLTASITLRDRPLPPTPQRQSLTDLIQAAGPLPLLIDTLSPKEPASTAETSQDIAKRPRRSFFEEVNILDGLSAGVAGTEISDKLYLPTTRLGSSARYAYSLPPVSPASLAITTPDPARTLPILRKSFRKTMTTVSGFHVRMRTVIIPQIYFPGNIDDEQETTSEESTVVLCIEIENSGESEAGFSVEEINVSIKGEAAKIRLIGWGEQGVSEPLKVFPLLIRSSEQYNLLYAVTFLRPPDLDLPQRTEEDISNDFQKSVSINIIGRPFTVPEEEFYETTDKLSYPTSSFLSRWNCVLDLRPRQRDSVPSPGFTLHVENNAMPLPASPFPAASPLAQQAQNKASALANAQLNTAVGTKRHTFGGTTSPFQSSVQRPMSLSPGFSSSSSLGRISPLSKLGMKPWTVETPLSGSGTLSPPLPPLPNNAQNQSPPSTATVPAHSFPVVPPTPAFPAYGSQPVTPRPISVSPSFGQMGSVGLGIDARRDRLTLSGMPQTPIPRLMAGERALALTSWSTGNPGTGARDFVVSVNLVPSGVRQHDDGPQASTSLAHQRSICLLDEFSLEIFVFNQSPYVRTLEATFADRMRRREERRDTYFSSASMNLWKPEPPGFTPLENRVRIGPLGPSTCQSVNMRFLALAPGVHSIDGLVLTDIDSGESISLRSVMDFAILSHKRDF